MYCPQCGSEAPDDANFCITCGANMHAAAIDPVPPVSPDTAAGFWRRFAARSVDSIVAYGFSFLVLVSLTPSNVPVTAYILSAPKTATLVGMGSFLVYFTFLHGAFGQTFGKMLLGIRVVGVSGARISYGRALVRSLGDIVSAVTLSLGYVLAALNKRKRALHDFLAGTVVVRVRPAKPSDKAIIGIAVFLGFAGAVGVMAAVALPQIIAARQKAFDEMVKTDLKSAALAEEAFFRNRFMYTINPSDLGGFKPSDGGVRLVIRPGRDGLARSYLIVARHAQSPNAFFFSSRIGEVKDVTLAQVREAGITGLE